MAAAFLAFKLGVLLIQARRCACSGLYPVIVPQVKQDLAANSSDGGYYRELFVNEADGSLYVGGRNYMYKLNLKTQNYIGNGSAPSSGDLKPNFMTEESMSGKESDSTTDFFRYININKDLLSVTQLLATEKVASSYKLDNITFKEQCRRQVEMLTFYYGSSVQMPLDDPDIVCAAHVRGLAAVRVSPNQEWLFSLRTGLFGTLPVAPLGVNDFDKGWPAWRKEVESVAASQDEAVNYTLSTLYQPEEKLLNLVYERIANASRTCYSCNSTYAECMDHSRTTSSNVQYKQICYNPPAIENYMGLYGHCDYHAAPARILYNSSSLDRIKADPFVGNEREACSGGLLASLMLAGYHPDQRTIAYMSQTGNGPNGNQTAIYVLTEIGQEKQLDMNHEAFMGYEDPAPLTSSASLSIVRLLVKDNDVDTGSVLISNPFKHTWVTSPATKFGRMVKTGNMATVSRRPRAVGIFEDDAFIYFFFREMDWESIPHPEYSIQRYHYLWRSYDRTVSYPWEKAFISDNYILQPERTDPLKYWLYQGKEDVTARNPTEARHIKSFLRNQHVYSPSLHGWEQTWNEGVMTSRVARVCKNDKGLPTGTFDASFFNFDNRLTLSSFQTFLKTRLTCSVAVPAVPRSWRIRRDLYSFYWTLYFSQYPEFDVQKNDNFKECTDAKCGSPDVCHRPFYNCTACPPLSLGDAAYKGASCSLNKGGRDAAFRAFSNYANDFSEEVVDKAAFRLISDGWKDFHWSYAPRFPTYSASYVRYSELRDIFRIGDNFYGVFGSHLSEEQVHASKASTRQRPQQALYGSAVCKYTLKDIRRAFNGPFKKRINNSWRPFDPRIEGDPVIPSPYECQHDPVGSQAPPKMNIDFADFTLPLEKELKDFDLRAKSSRLNFFEKDVEGSRTMWQDVKSSAVLSQSGKIFDKIVVDNSSSYEVMFIATSVGEILKIATWPQEEQCWQTDKQRLMNWWKNRSKLFNNTWLPYFNMTQEADTRIPDDFVFTSQWDCSPSTNHTILAVLKPFNEPQKIWDMKLYDRQLILATDSQVVQLSVEQCEQYSYCGACARDPYCGWSVQPTKCHPYKAGLIQNVTGLPGCKTSCASIDLVANLNDDVMLDTSVSKRGDALGTLSWYHNNTLIVESFRKVLRTENGSLLILNMVLSDLGHWELRDPSTGMCIIAYNLVLSDCSTPECKYRREYDEWRGSYDVFKDNALRWYNQMQDGGCLKTPTTPSL